MTTIKDVPVSAGKSLDSYFLAAKANPELYHEGTKWYKTAHSQIAALSDYHKVPLAVTCGITARLSPSISWSRNITATDNLLRGKPTIDGYSRNVDIARKLLAGEWGTTDCGVSGSFPKNARKTFAFYHNLLHVTKSRFVTIDRWMIRAMYEEAQARELPAEFAVGPRAYRDASELIKQLGKRHKLHAIQVQACIWLAVRVKWNTKVKQ